MDNSQFTNIAIRVGELGAKTSFTFWVAVISAFAALCSAAIAGIFAWKLNLANKQHEKQWTYITKVSLLIDNAIEIFSRMLFNKFILAYNNNDQSAYQNLFLLQKDILVVESQFVVYGPLEIAESIYNFKNFIIQTSNEEFLSKWNDIYQKGNELLLLCRKELGKNISAKFQDFARGLIELPLQIPSGVTIESKTMGSITIREVEKK